MSAISGDPVLNFGELFPGITESSGGLNGRVYGVQQVVSWMLGRALQVDGTTYLNAAFVAPVNGCFIKELWVSAMVLIAGGTNTLAFDNYDASANAAGNILSTTNVDPVSNPAVVNEGTQLTLTTTLEDRVMDEGDVLSSTLVAGTQTTQGEGYVATAIIIVPVVL